MPRWRAPPAAPSPRARCSLRRAALFLALLLAVGLGVLLQLDRFAILVGAASLPLVFPYPLMKRITHWPQAWLGLTFNWGALLGWAAATGALAPPALALYAAGLFWTLGYDTIYAHQDKEDDIVVGVKSTALALGRATPVWLWVFYGVAVALFALAGGLAGLAWPFYPALAFAGMQLAWQAARVDIDDAGDCLAKFNSNRWFGWALLAAIVLGRLA